MRGAGNAEYFYFTVTLDIWRLSHIASYNDSRKLTLISTVCLNNKTYQLRNSNMTKYIMIE